jgi:hypothetical protein
MSGSKTSYKKILSRKMSYCKFCEKKVNHTTNLCEFAKADAQSKTEKRVYEERLISVLNQMTAENSFTIIKSLTFDQIKNIYETKQSNSGYQVFIDAIFSNDVKMNSLFENFVEINKFYQYLEKKCLGEDFYNELCSLK